MNTTTSRRGSALLIVLGMLSFLIVSAVGFATYMRYARMPSSYLRRTSSSRMLVKAAMAEAIDFVDRAINNNPHPNIGDKPAPGADRKSGGQVRNRWDHRVLRGTTEALAADGESDSSVVTPLCLEALAYIPPPLINEARYYSTKTPTARWSSMGFDAGRYTFCAIDVSDYLEINRLMADRPRSSAPNGRISLAYLFENESHRSAGGEAAEWDQFMEKFRRYDRETLEIDFEGKYPLISLADWNLALGQETKVGGLWSPFYDYVSDTGTKGIGIAGGRGMSEDILDTFNRMTFVTDGWFPKTAASAEQAGGKNGANGAKAKDEDELFDLNDPANQPFTMRTLETKGSTPNPAGAIFGTAMQRTQEWQSRLSSVGCAALFDYLDTDHVPLSLAMPTTERVPMICGMRPTMPGSVFALEKTMEPEGDEEVEVLNETEDSRRVKKTIKYQVDAAKFVQGLGTGDLKALVVFPFNHKDETDGTWSMDGRFSLFFSSDRMSTRTGEMNDVLHLSTKVVPNSGLDPNTGVMSVRLQEQAIAKFDNITRPEDAVREVNNRLADGRGTIGTSLRQAGNEFVTITYEWDQHKDNNTGGVVAMPEWTPKFGAIKNNKDYITKATCGIKILKANGTPDPDFSADVATILKNGGKEVRLNAAAWLRVKEGGKVVDMVPACLQDDKIQNAVGTIAQLEKVGEKFAGKHFPLMRFDTGVTFPFSITGLDELVGGGKEVKLVAGSKGKSAVLVADPRFNHAPEQWFQCDEEDISKNVWIQNNHCADGIREGDIFMATSDSGYMQSKYELAFLPAFTDLRTVGNDVTIGNMQTLEGVSLASFPESFGACVNNDFMWNTYTPFTQKGADAFYELPWTSEGTGYKICPYSDSRNVLMAAFANTPMDWKRASTNVVEGAEDYAGMKASDYNKKYALNEYSQGAKFAWQDLQDIAVNFMNSVRAVAGNAGADADADVWEDAWDDLDWRGNDTSFCGVNLRDETDDLWNVDRKFLYGYWRDCFAAKQQLFLVFVRAEPMMMGGGSAGQLPPQLSGKAVALVWRDPAPSKEDTFPHQTRVLFYRQFE